MSQIEAIYQKGVFKPLGDVGLKENQRVRLQVEPIDPASWDHWLAEVKNLHDTVQARAGVLPDSTPDIAQDRIR